VEYRVENKYIISDLDMAVLSKRLEMIMKNDVHQDGNCYTIRSVYFDDALDSCMDENDAGIDCRKKYRIRTYGTTNSPIKLEIKEKRNGFTKKTSCNLTQNECYKIFENYSELEMDNRKEWNQLLLQMKCNMMRPKTIVEYERTAFVHPVGNVRITFDRNIIASKCHEDFFENEVTEKIPLLPTGWHILEVKYDELLPDIIAKQLELGKLQQIAFSKYYLGRLAINGDFIRI